MNKMPDKLSAEVEKRLREDQVIWLTTVRADGVPLPTPVSFHWNGETVLIYTTPNSLKLHNIAVNPHAALNLNSDSWGRDAVVLIGSICEDRAAPPMAHNPAYLEKYQVAIRAGLGMTPESFSQKFCIPLRFTPERIRVF